MPRAVVTRLVAILLLLVAGAAVYACGLSDSCVSMTPGNAAGCDDPGGDACFCCCNHVVPAVAFTLEPGDAVCDAPPDAPAEHLASRALPIDHPPQN